MKKLLLITTGLIGMSCTLAAQIPNNGFENWNNMGSYMDPQGYLTPNSSAVSVYPVTRSTDHFPTSLGSYSIRLENNPSLLPNADALGLVLQNSTNVLMNGPGAAFPVTGHPTSLTGYYKYLPLNGDTMRIQASLYLNGSEVSHTEITSTATVSNWTSFNIPFSTYTSADSCSIMFAAYNSDGPPPAYVPHGNSVLYVDNLNFDNLLISVQEQNPAAQSFYLYPNPAADFIVMNFDQAGTVNAIVNIYNCTGKLVRSEAILEKTQFISTSALPNGIYLFELRSGMDCQWKKIVIQK